MRLPIFLDIHFSFTPWYLPTGHTGLQFYFRVSCPAVKSTETKKSPPSGGEVVRKDILSSLMALPSSPGKISLHNGRSSDLASSAGTSSRISPMIFRSFVHITAGVSVSALHRFPISYKVDLVTVLAMQLLQAAFHNAFFIMANCFFIVNLFVLYSPLFRRSLRRIDSSLLSERQNTPPKRCVCNNHGAADAPCLDSAAAACIRS